MSITLEVQKITQAAELASNETRFIQKIELGQAVRQGDLYLFRIQKDVKNAQLVWLTNNQLVPGETQGSRHCAQSPARIYSSDGTRAEGISTTALLGPIVESTERFEVTHPEHAHISLPAGTYQVLYQLDFQAQRRVAD